MELIKLIGGSLLAIGTNIILGTTIANFENVYDKDKFWLGVRKAGAVLVSVAALYVIGNLLPDMNFEFIGVNASLQDILEMVGAATVILYVGKDLENLVKVIGLSTDSIDKGEDM